MKRSRLSLSHQRSAKSDDVDEAAAAAAAAKSFNSANQGNSARSFTSSIESDSEDDDLDTLDIDDDLVIDDNADSIDSGDDNNNNDDDDSNGDDGGSTGTGYSDNLIDCDDDDDDDDDDKGGCAHNDDDGKHQSHQQQQQQQQKSNRKTLQIAGKSSRNNIKATGKQRGNKQADGVTECTTPTTAADTDAAAAATTTVTPANPLRKQNAHSRQNSQKETIKTATASKLAGKKGPVGSGETGTAAASGEPISSSCFSPDFDWGQMHLSKPLIKALHELGFSKPTIIQRNAIPLALLGRDLLGTSRTGSGKTAAFLLPILERLLRSPSVFERRVKATGEVKGGAFATKALILLPTRELARQCFDMLAALSKYTPITELLVSGGLDLKAQEFSFRNQPDIVVATPGRVLDLLLNSQSVHLELLEIVVLDEADRLLELGFKEECLRILKLCSRSRQTLLFSATLSESIKDLAALSLRRPLKLDVTASHSLPEKLQQVLVKIVPVTVTAPTVGKARKAHQQTPRHYTGSSSESSTVTIEDSDESHSVPRESVLLHLCFGPYKDKRTIVFFRTKRAAHRVALIFRLLQLPHAELHGNLSHAKRVESVEQFQQGKENYRILLCSELAARGLDLTGVELVINFHVPLNISKYVHQVGRTARIGHSGTAITFYRLSEKRTIKHIIKSVSRKTTCPPPLHREVSPETITRWASTVFGLEDEIKKLLKQEQLERELRIAEMHVAKAQNVQDFHDEIMSTPERQWIDRVTAEAAARRRRALGKRTAGTYGTRTGGDDEGDAAAAKEEEAILAGIEKVQLLKSGFDIKKRKDENDNSDNDDGGDERNDNDDENDDEASAFACNNKNDSDESGCFSSIESDDYLDDGESMEDDNSDNPNEIDDDGDDSSDHSDYDERSTKNIKSKTSSSSPGKRFSSSAKGSAAQIRSAKGSAAQIRPAKGTAAQIRSAEGSTVSGSAHIKNPTAELSKTSTKKEKQQMSRRRDEKNRMRKMQKQTNLTAAQLERQKNFRTVKAIGKRVKKSQNIRRQNVDSDDD